ncbi:hypothetical protein C5688_10780, partial [Methylocystis sp. MitZ-2018]
MGDNAFYDVFLSYARSDSVDAADLDGWLRAQGLRVFFDRSELRPGLRWVPALEEAIGKSKAVVILVGRYGLGNTQQYERELALVRQTRDNRFPVIPVILPGCENPPTGFLQLLTWIDLSRGEKLLSQTDNLQALLGVIQGKEVVPSKIRADICPYRGLEPFREEDAAFFCGRDDAIRDLVARVQTHSFVAVIGPSGSGKSSLVFAGLLPALRQQRDTTMWDVISFRPGAFPLRTLAAAFGTPPENVGPAGHDTYLEKEAADYRNGDADMLGRVISSRLDAMPEKPDRLLIYVDQWEELYAMAPSTQDSEKRQKHSNDVDKFISLLIAASSDPRFRTTVVLTVRADFYNPLIRHRLLSDLLPRQQVNIPPMKRHDLRAAIETPAKLVGLTFSPPALVEEILDDVGAEEGRLPLLQFALKETWERRTNGKLTAEAYTEVGGVSGAIQKTAERAYAALTPAQQEAARRLFLRLVTPGEGQEDTRARSVIPNDPQQRNIIDLFSDRRTRLLVTGYGALQGQSTQTEGDIQATVEVAHEALIRRWSTLRKWVDTNRDKLRARAAIMRAKADWEESGKAGKFLLDPGVQLERGRDLLENLGDVPVDDLRDFVSLSIEKENLRLEAEREAQLADEKRISEAERNAKNIFVRLSGIALVLSLVLAIAVYVAWRGEDKARNLLAQANKAIAEGILSDLDLTRGDALTARQRNALWKLAATPDWRVREEFLSALSQSSENIVRVAPSFGLVCRSVGLQTLESAKGLLTAVVSAMFWAAEKDDRQGTSSIFKALGALPVNLTDTQAQQTLTVLVQQVGKTNDFFAHFALVDDIQALAAKLTETQAQQALTVLLQQFGKTTSPDALKALAEGINAMPAKLTETQAQQALTVLLQQFGKTTSPDALKTLVEGINAMPAKLTETQAQQALTVLLQQFGKTTSPDALKALAEGINAMPAKLTESQAQQALTVLLQQFGKTTSLDALNALAEGIKALSPNLTNTQAHQALTVLLQQIGRTTDPNALTVLAEGIQALPAKLTETQAQQALTVPLRQIGKTTHPSALWALTRALQALPAKLTETQAQQALTVLLQQVGKTNDFFAHFALVAGLQALAAKLTETQAQQALTVLLQQFGKTTSPDALKALAEGINAMPAKLTESQAQQALTVLLQQFGKTTS